jgi:hypothetical protein
MLERLLNRLHRWWRSATARWGPAEPGPAADPLARRAHAGHRAGGAGPAPRGEAGGQGPWGEGGGRHRIPDPRPAAGVAGPRQAAARPEQAESVPGPRPYVGPAGPGGARARIRKRQPDAEPFASPVRTQPAHGEAPGQTRSRRQAQPRTRGARDARGAARDQVQAQAEAAQAEVAQAQAQADVAVAMPWLGNQPRADGSRHCGTLEAVLRREWDASAAAPPEVLQAIERLAELPQTIKDMLARAVDTIHVGPGGVPELDEMGRLSGVPLPSGRATWDACAGAYGDRKIVVGTRPSPSPDVMCHEVGHAIDDSDAAAGKWQSDSAEFRMLYDQCLSHLVSDFHKQPGALGRREFFADAFAAIASRQRPALVDMLGGSTRVALNVMLYFNRRYGI